MTQRSLAGRFATTDLGPVGKGPVSPVGSVLPPDHLRSLPTRGFPRRRSSFQVLVSFVRFIVSLLNAGTNEYRVMISRPRGFTVMESMVVIDIIAVLIALLLPAVELARDDARSAHGVTNLQQ